MIQTHLQPLDGATALGLGGTFQVWAPQIDAPWSLSLRTTPGILEEPWQRAEREQAAVYG